MSSATKQEITDFATKRRSLSRQLGGTELDLVNKYAAMYGTTQPQTTTVPLTACGMGYNHTTTAPLSSSIPVSCCTLPRSLYTYPCTVTVHYTLSTTPQRDLEYDLLLTADIISDIPFSTWWASSSWVFSWYLEYLASIWSMGRITDHMNKRNKTIRICVGTSKSTLRNQMVD